MLTDIDYSGYYQDDDMTVNIKLDDPMRYDLDANKMVFKVTVSSKCYNYILHTEDFMFYLMDDRNRLHNVELVL